jgi:hypothetical protein
VNSLLPLEPDFVERAGRTLSPQALKPGKPGYLFADAMAQLYADSGDNDQAFIGLNTA